MGEPRLWFEDEKLAETEAALANLVSAAKSYELSSRNDC